MERQREDNSSACHPCRVDSISYQWIMHFTREAVIPEAARNYRGRVSFPRRCRCELSAAANVTARSFISQVRFANFVLDRKSLLEAACPCENSSLMSDNFRQV